MKKLIGFSAILFLIASCTIQNSSETNSDDNAIYHLGLNPAAGSQYQYAITNESRVKMEVDEKAIENINNADVSITYTIDKDSAGNFLMHTAYNTLQLYSKSGDKEISMNAANAATSRDPVERMLGLLQAARITAIVAPNGLVKEVKGYKELGEQLTAGFADHDGHSKEIAQGQWERLIGQGLIQKNMDQLFTIFPDSAVRRGEKWKLVADAGDEFGLKAHTFYQLKAINETTAIIEAEGVLESDEGVNNVAGYSAMANLKGSQQGRYEMEAKTGMMQNCTITSTIKGTIQVMGREVPITIETELHIKGKKIK